MKKTTYYRLSFWVSVLALSISAAIFLNPVKTWADGQVKVGILHSLTGTMAISETSIIDFKCLVDTKCVP